ncbi:MAG: formylglycine-generating enzyme family protein [Lentisphaerae bacterium]|nr:formylglycine-generating enzyme family protein [Lentisphaerota bacterium]
MRNAWVWVMVMLAATSASLNAAVPVVTNVVAQQRATTKLVDIHYDVFDADGDTLKIRVEVSDNGGNRYSVPAFSLTGDIGENVTTGANKHIVWDAGIDWDGEYSDEMRVKVLAVDTKGFPGLAWGNEVPPGGFLMGQDGGAEGSGPSRHVNIPWSYWLSKYEIRNDQFCDFLNTTLVAEEVYREGTSAVRAEMGRFPGVPGNARLIYIGDTKDIRWNVNNFEVVGGRSNFPVRVSWYGAMAFAQHYGYDLPTEAEWEKAARGPDHDDEDEHLAYPWGDTINGGNANYYSSGDPYYSSGWGPSPVGYFDGNQTPLGPDMATGYSLYDVAGNVEEWCRSTWLSTVENYSQQESMSNAVNYISTSASRVFRGGSHTDGTDYLKCYSRNSTGSIDSDNSSQAGFRVARRDLDYSDPMPIVAVSENFDGAAWVANASGSWTIVATSGTWTAGSKTYMRRDEALARTDTGCIQLSQMSYSSTLSLPSTVGNPVGISLWARAVQSDNTGSIDLQEYDGTAWRTTDSVSVSGISYQKIRLNVVLTQPTSGQSFRLSGSHGVYLDDLQIFTVPR